MAIRRSLTAEIAQLVSQLGSGNQTDRESAVARLAIIGTRAQEPLAGAVQDGSLPAVTRVLALRALSAMHARLLPGLAVAMLRTDDTTVATAAVEVVTRVALDRGTEATAAFEQLTDLVLDSSVSGSVRLEALDALKKHPSQLIAPILTALQLDGDERLAAAASAPQGPSGPVPIIVAMRDTAAAAADAVGQVQSDTPAIDLLHAIEAARERERQAPTEGEAWRLVRARLHQELAAQGSRLALYDLREAFEGARAPLPMGFVVAITGIGDRSCLESLARAWTAVTPEHTSWRAQIARAFSEIANRDAVGRQSAALKKIVMRWPEAAALVATAPAATARGTTRRPNTTSRTRR
jgi:hypothetical protein